MLFLMGVLALLLTTPNANADDKEKYKLFAEETRKEVWALKLPEFTNTAIPDKYKDESAVILAAHSRLEITKKTRFNVGAFLGGFHYIDREVNCRDLYRMLVQINDKAALKEFSEFDYKAEIRKKDWRYDENYQQVLGVRIIKPDGTVNEISTDEYMTATEGKKDQEQLQKLAVPGLEIGDKVDIFFFNYTSLENHNLDPFVFRFRQSHPMLSYTVHCEIDDKLTTQYRTLNGAPDFKQSKDENGNILLDVAVKDIEQTEPDLWYNPMQQTPMTLMYITNSKMKKYTYIPKSTTEKGLQSNPDAAAIQEDDWEFIKQAQKYSGYGGLSSPKKGIRLLRNVKQIKKKDWTDEKKADFIYNYYRFALLSDIKSDCNNELFIIYFQGLLDWVDVPNLFGMVTNEDKEPLDKLTNYRNTTWLLALPESQKYYLPPTAYLIPHEIPARYQGRQAILEPDKKKAKKLKTKAEREHFNLPAGTADDNQNITTIQADIDNTLLTVSRNEYRTGTQKEYMQSALVKLEDVDAAYRLLLSIDKEFAEEVGKKYADDLREAFRKGREQEKEDYKWEIDFYHGENAKELLGYQMQCLGNRPDSAAFIYNVRYTMDGYIRKAGPNYVLSAGRLIGEQTQIEGKERKRSADIYMSAPRTFQWNITVNLPEGYKAAPEGVEKLNVKVENECGAFIAKAVTENGKLILNILKRYNHKTEPAANWEKLLQIQEAIENATIPNCPRLKLTASIGGVISEDGKIDEAIAKADQLMYKAKDYKAQVITECDKTIFKKEKIQNKPRILIVDASEFNRAILKEILEETYEIIEADGGNEALHKIDEYGMKISLVLLDIIMPEKDGFEVLKYMEEERLISDIPVIIISSEDSANYIRRAYEMGVSDYINRPFDANIVYQRVSNTVKLYAKQRRLMAMVTRV